MEGKLNRVLSAAVVAVIAFALSLWGNGLGFLLSLSLLCGAVGCKLAARRSRNKDQPPLQRRFELAMIGLAVTVVALLLSVFLNGLGYLPRLCPAVCRCGVRPGSPFPPVNDLSMR